MRAAFPRVRNLTFRPCQARSPRRIDERKAVLLKEGKPVLAGHPRDVSRAGGIPTGVSEKTKGGAGVRTPLVPSPTSTSRNMPVCGVRQYATRLSWVCTGAHQTLSASRAPRECATADPLLLSQAQDCDESFIPIALEHVGARRHICAGLCHRSKPPDPIMHASS